MRIGEIGSRVQAFRRQRPEIPHRGRRAHIGLRVALLGVNEVRELVRVADEEHRRVVAEKVPIAFSGVELERETAHVALGVRGGVRLTARGAANDGRLTGTSEL